MADHLLYRLSEIDTTAYQYVRQLDTGVLYDAVTRYMQTVMQAAQAARSIFVDMDTSNYKELVQFPGGGVLDESTPDSTPLPVQANGGYDTAYPLYHYQNSIRINMVKFRKMGLTEFERHIDTIISRYNSRMRLDIMYALFQNTTQTFKDELWGSLTLQPLANGDSVEYPAYGATIDPRTVDNFVVSGYTAANISDTNNPVQTAQDYFETQFGAFTGGAPVYCYINSAQTAKVRALTDFVPVETTGVSDVTSFIERLTGFTELPSPNGKVLGTVNGAVVSQLSDIPANYMLSVHPGEPKPLVRRIDPIEQGLSADLELVNGEPESRDGTMFSNYQARFGIGVRNRLNGHVIQFKASGQYEVPTAYENRPGN